MNIEKNVNLSKYTSLKIGGIANNFYRPQSLEELKELSKSLKKFYILSAGSNVLIDDRCDFEHVIYMGDYENDLLSIDESGVITTSSSVRIQQLLNFANRNGYGGAEYLYSLPAMVGGIVAMNAGRGKAYNKNISDYILSVDVIVNGEFKTLSKDECGFAYRKSNLTNDRIIIHAVKFKFDEISIEEGKQRLKERMDYSKRNQAIHLPSAGSVFKKYSSKLIRIVRLFPQSKEGLYFSEKTLNWISNGGKGTYEQAIKLIKRAQFLHKIFGKEVELEWHIWTCESK